MSFINIDKMGLTSTKKSKFNADCKLSSFTVKLPCFLKAKKLSFLHLKLIKTDELCSFRVSAPKTFDFYNKTAVVKSRLSLLSLYKLDTLVGRYLYCVHSFRTQKHLFCKHTWIIITITSQKSLCIIYWKLKQLRDRIFRYFDKNRTG